MTDAERIAVLEEAVVTARREASVVSLQLLTVISSDDATHYTGIKMRLLLWGGSLTGLWSSLSFFMKSRDTLRSHGRELEWP